MNQKEKLSDIQKRKLTLFIQILEINDDIRKQTNPDNRSTFTFFLTQRVR